MSLSLVILTFHLGCLLYFIYFITSQSLSEHLTYGPSSLQLFPLPWFFFLHCRALGVGEGAGFVWCCYLGRALCWEIQEPLWCRVRQDADSNWSLSPGMVKNMLPSSEACLTESMMALLLRIPRISLLKEAFWLYTALFKALTLLQNRNGRSWKHNCVRGS